jgi:hypothetical protein
MAKIKKKERQKGYYIPKVLNAVLSFVEMGTFLKEPP